MASRSASLKKRSDSMLGVRSGGILYQAVSIRWSVEGGHSWGIGEDRSRFRPERRRFSSRRRAFAAREGRVFRRGTSSCNASLTSSAKRSTAASLFATWLRWRCEETCSTPALVIRVASLSRNRAFCPSEKTAEAPTSKRTVTRVSSLLTFCPPGPPLRDVVKEISSSGMARSGVMGIMAGAYDSANRDGDAGLSSGRSSVRRFETLTPPAPLSQPPPRRPGEREPEGRQRKDLLLAVLPLLPADGGEAGRRGPG